MDTEQKIVSNAALVDDRPQSLKDKDYSTEELASAGAPAVPFQNPKPLKPTATEYDQWYVGSCVPHGFWTQLEYEGLLPTGFKPSQLRSYRKRINYAGAGSIGTDMYDQIRGGQSGDFPTPAGFTESQATAMPYIPGDKIIKDFKYFQYIDKKTGAWLRENVPADVAIGKAVAIFIYATEEEWSKEYVEIKTPNLKIENASVRHCICIVPKGDFTENGKRWLAVQDSAKFGGRGFRYIEYDNFFMQRSYFMAKVYATGDLPQPEPVPVIGKPVDACEFGDKNDAVRALQKFLIDEGKLDAKYLTGYYGSLTAKAVLWWQLEHWEKFSVNVPQLLDWAGKYWGSQSIAIIKS